MELQTFCKLLYPCAEEGWLALNFFPDKKTQWVKADEINLAKIDLTGKNCYLGIGIRQQPLTSDKRGDASHVIAIPGFWVDLDFDDGNTHRAKNLPPSLDACMAMLDDAPYRPSLVVHSGHGLQAYWLFNEPWYFEDDGDRQYAARLAKGWESWFQIYGKNHGWHVDSTADLARVFRIPGTYNHKTDPPVQARIIQESLVRYEPSDFDDWLQEDTPHSAPVHDNDIQVSDILKATTISDRLKFLIVSGDVIGKYPSRSEAVFAVTSGLIRAKIDDSSIVSTLLNPNYRISEMPIEKGRKWVESEVERVHKKLSLNGTYASSNGHVPDNSNTPTFNEPDKSDHIPLSDTYNASRLVNAYGDNLRYVGEWDRILVYVDGVWPIDHKRKSFEYAKSVVMQQVKEARTLLQKAESEEEEELADAYFKHAKASLSTAKLNAMLVSVQSCYPLPISHRDLNPHRDLLPLDNGVVNLRTGQFSAHNPAYLFTAKMAVSYDPNATCPIWERTLHVIFGGAPIPDSIDDSAATLETRFEADARAKRLVDCLQRILGYALTAEILTHALFLLVGKGRNGKSLIVNTMLKMFGDLGCVVNQSLFMETKNDHHPTERATLFGKRIAVTSETSKNRKLNEAFVKTATGDDLMNARRMREDEWQFQPTHTLFIATNHRPVADPDDFALWERIWLLPFDQVFYDPDKLSDEELADPTILKQDKHLPEKLQAELPGILNWCIKGCVDYYREGLLMPEEVRMATQSYRADENNVQGFVQDPGACTTDANRDPKLLPDDAFNDSAKNLYARYLIWCEENEVHAESQTTFGTRLRALGFERYTSNGRARYKSIKVAESAEANERVKSFNDK